MTKFFKVLLLTVFLTFQGSLSFAHSELVSTDPLDGAVLTVLPQTFIVTYNEDLISDGSFAVLVNEGVATDLVAEVVANDVIITMPSDLESGVYSVEYKTVASDGHPQEGIINFTYAIEEAATTDEEAPLVINPSPIEETEVVIEQPVVEETSNLMPVLGALALVLVAAALLFRMRSKNKG
ncbi:MAG: copper resistance CopC family protein [Candidatus Nanopelagicales bacterium]